MQIKPIPDSARHRLHYDHLSGRIYWCGTNKYHPRLDGREAGSVRDGRRVIKIDGASYFAHRIAWYLVTGTQPAVIDHVNGDPLDNRLENLRATDCLGNAKNHGRTENGSGLPCGVRKAASGRYVARIGANKRLIHIGTFDTPAEAEKAYLRKREKLFGEFHRSNP